MSYKYIEDRQAYHRAYMAQRRAWLREHHFCTECKTQDAYTLAGRARCANCCARSQGYRPSDAEREQAKARAKALRTARRDAGLCTNCGRGLFPDGHVSCPTCRARWRRKSERKRREQGIVPRSEWTELGLCWSCGKAAAEGETKWGGTKLKMCPDCYARLCEASKKGRQTYYEAHGETWGQHSYDWMQKLRGRKLQNGT